MGSSPTAGSRAEHPVDDAAWDRSRHQTEKLFPHNETKADDSGSGASADLVHRWRRERRAASGCVGAPAFGPNIPDIERARGSLRAPSSSTPGRYQSGQMDQTVNLVAQPSAVRIRLSPPFQRTAVSRRQHGHRAHVRGVVSGLLLGLISRRRRAPVAAADRRGSAGGGRSSMVERQPSKLHTRVRFPSPAPRAWPQLFGSRVRQPATSRCCSSVVEHFLGKEEVLGSSPSSSSTSQHGSFLNNSSMHGRRSSRRSLHPSPGHRPAKATQSIHG